MIFRATLQSAIHMAEKTLELKNGIIALHQHWITSAALPLSKHCLTPLVPHYSAGPSPITSNDSTAKRQRSPKAACSDSSAVTVPKYTAFKCMKFH